jgi:hypothetical protein
MRGRGRKEGSKGKKEGVWAAGLLGCFSLLLFFSFFFSTLKLFTQFLLNSNEFEFKLYTLHINKTNAPA